MKKKKFLRCKWRTYPKLGRGRKKKQKYRKAKGRHNKIREKNRGNPRRVEIGYKQKFVKKPEIIVVSNVKQLQNLKNKEIKLSGIGRKKKLAIIEEARKLNLKIINLNIKKFLKKVEQDKKFKAGKRKQKDEKEKKKVKEKEKVKEAKEKKNVGTEEIKEKESAEKIEEKLEAEK